MLPIVSSWQVVAYILIPLGLSLANAVGICGGFLRVLVLMDILQYAANEATYLSYPFVFGGGLINFCLLIFKLDQKGDTLVDYILVMVLLPSQVFGVMVGNIITNLTSVLVADTLTVLFFVIIAAQFAVKLAREISIKELDGSSALLSSERQDSQVQKQPLQQDGEEIGGVRRFCMLYKVDFILASALVFVLFQALAELTQGKIFKFTACSPFYFTGMAALTVSLLVYLFFLRRHIPKMIGKERQRCRTLGIKYQPRTFQIRPLRNYATIVLTAFCGGIVSGILGAGVGSIIVVGLLSAGVPAAVSSATSGYQIVFSGAAALLQAFSNDQLRMSDFYFLLVLALVGSLVGALLMHFVMNRFKFRKLQLGILAVLNGLIAVGVVPNAIFDIKYFGWKYMNAISGFIC